MRDSLRFSFFCFFFFMTRLPPRSTLFPYTTLFRSLSNVRQVSHFGERAVAIVVKQPARCRVVNARNAIVAVARFGVPAEFVFGFVEVDEAAYKKVESAVVIVVKPDGAGSPARGCDPLLLDHIRKCPVAVVSIENTAAILRYVEVGEAVSVVIADCHTHPVAASRDPRLFGDVRERAIAIVVIESIAKRRTRIIKIALAAVHQIDVHPSVVVVIEEGTAGSSSFRQKHLRRPPVTVHPSDPTDRWQYLFERLRRSRACASLR